MNGNESDRPLASVDTSVFAQPTWTKLSPEWIELDREIEPDHLVRRIARLIEQELNLQTLNSTYRGRGTPAHRPDLLLKLVIYEHFKGHHQPKQWLTDLHENKPVQWLTFGIKPSRTSLYEFRDRIESLHEQLNQQVIRTAIGEGHTDASCGSLDGTMIAANATRHRLVNLDTVEKRLAIMDQEIALAESQTPTAKCEVDQPTPMPLTCEVAPPTSTPAPVSSPSPTDVHAPRKMGWKAKTLRGQKRQRANYRRARDVLRAKQATNARRRKDKRKQEQKIRVAIGDPQAPLGLDKLKTYRPLYNVQIMSDVGSDLVLAYATTATVVDSGQLLGMLDRTKTATGRQLKEALVDSGYPSGAELAECEKRGVVVYSPWNENSWTQLKCEASAKTRQIPKDQFQFDAQRDCYVCPEGKQLAYRGKQTKQRADGSPMRLSIYQAEASDCGECPQKSRCVVGQCGGRSVRRQEHDDLIEELKLRMNSPEGKEKYAQRGETVERRFADVKAHRKLTRASGQTPGRVGVQVGLTILAHNLITVDKLRSSNIRHTQNTGKMTR